MAMGKKLIILANPPYSRTEKRLHNVQNYPIGILTVGSILQSAGYDVKLFDCVYEDDYETRIVELLDKALFIGISAMTQQLPCALDLAAAVKKSNPSVPIVWGGIHPSLEPEQTLSSGLCDIAVIGECDLTISDLAQRLANADPLDGIPGLAFLRNGNFVFSGPAPFPEYLDTLPPMNFDLVKLDNYLDLDVDKTWGAFPQTPGSVRRLTIPSARGCPFKCRFCINSIIRGTGKRYRAMSVEKLLMEIRRYKEMYNLNFISFGDDLFFSNPKRTREIVERLISENLEIKWYANIRADFIREGYIDSNFLLKIKEAGCIRLAIGVESGSQRVLDYLDKHLSPQQTLHAAKELGQADLMTGYSLMTGLPGENDEDIFRTMCLMYAIALLHPRSYFIGPQPYRPYPGSKLFDDCIKLGWKKPATLEDWSVNIEKTGNLSISSMVWVSNKELVEKARNFSTEIYRGTAEMTLRSLCPDILDEFLELASLKKERI